MNPRFYFSNTRKAAASIYGDGCSSIHVILELWVVLFSGSIKWTGTLVQYSISDLY